METMPNWTLQQIICLCHDSLFRLHHCRRSSFISISKLFLWECNKCSAYVLLLHQQQQAIIVVMYLNYCWLFDEVRGPFSLSLPRNLSMGRMEGHLKNKIICFLLLFQILIGNCLCRFGSRTDEQSGRSARRQRTCSGLLHQELLALELINTISLRLRSLATVE